MSRAGELLEKAKGHYTVAWVDKEGKARSKNFDKNSDAIAYDKKLRDEGLTNIEHYGPGDEE